MKRKLALIITALTCAVACAICLAACGGGGSGGGGKTVYGLVMIDGEGAEYTEYLLEDVIYSHTLPNYGNIKLNVKYSDGTMRELKENEVTVEYSFNGNALAEAPKTYSLGCYRETYKYDGYSATISFYVVTSPLHTPYSIQLDNETWTYLEEPTITVLDRSLNEVDVKKSDIFYISEEQYNTVKDEDSLQKLHDNSDNVYTNLVDGSHEYRNLHPGVYYFFAYMYDSDCDKYFNSTLQKVTINKAALTPVYEDDFDSFALMNTGWSRGETGTIKISRIGITTNIYNAEYDTVIPIGGGITWKTASGETADVQWTLEWKNPDEEVDCSVSGQRRQFKCVFSGGRYEDYIFPNMLEVELGKYSVDVPYIVDSNFTVLYDGQDHDILLGYSGTLTEDRRELYNQVVTIKDEDGNVLTVGEDGFLTKKQNEGTYTFTLELKDKVNYEWEWIDYSDGYDYMRDTDDKTLTYTITPKYSWINPFPNKNYYDVSIDENRQIVLKVESGTDEDTSGASPYKTGTLQATILSEYIFNGYTYTNDIDATVTVESRADSYDYIIITVTDFKELPNNYSGALLLKVTAKGDNHYADIERVFENLSISRYSYADVSSVTCPLDGMLTDNTMEQPAGITVAELYVQYPELTTALGKWSLEYDYGNTGDWTPLGDESVLPQMTLKCRLVFKSNFVNNVDQIAVYEFTLIGTPNN